MLTIEERLLVLERSSRRWRVAAVTASLCVVACVLAAAAASNNLVVVGSVRAKSFQVWDHDRGDLVLDVEDSFAAVNASLKIMDDRVKTCEVHTASAYRLSGAEKIDTDARASADAKKAAALDRAAMLSELHRLNDEIARARADAANAEQRRQMDAWLDRPNPLQYDSAAQVANELRLIRDQMEMWNLPRH